MSLGYAIRYAHSPYEAVSGADLEGLARLVSLLASVVGEESRAAAASDLMA